MHPPTKAATDQENWIRGPAGSDPDPNSLTHGTFYTPGPLLNWKFVKNLRTNFKCLNFCTKFSKNIFDGSGSQMLDPCSELIRILIRIRRIRGSSILICGVVYNTRMNWSPN